MSRRSGFARALAALDLGWVRVAMGLKIADISRMDEAAKKTVLRLFPYGLYAVTVKHSGEEHGMTANWVTQASFDPPMVVVAVENTSKTIGMIRDTHHFAVNVLSQGQRELAGKLGRSSANTPQKLKGVKTKPAPVSGAPILAEALGWVECRVVATLPSGDHTLVLGEVVEAGVEHDGGQPLTLQEAGFKYAGSGRSYTTLQPTIMTRTRAAASDSAGVAERLG